MYDLSDCPHIPPAFISREAVYKVQVRPVLGFRLWGFSADSGLREFRFADLQKVQTELIQMKKNLVKSLLYMYRTRIILEKVVKWVAHDVNCGSLNRLLD